MGNTLTRTWEIFVSNFGKLGAVVLIVIVGIVAFKFLKVLKPSNMVKI